VLQEGAYQVMIGTVVGRVSRGRESTRYGAASARVGKINNQVAPIPVVMIGAPLLLALLAGYWPARRSTHINPVTALRQE
jgi:ABC-type lipoprotein release transport system permease subunit